MIKSLTTFQYVRKSESNVNKSSYNGNKTNCELCQNIIKYLFKIMKYK